MTAGVSVSLRRSMATLALAVVALIATPLASQAAVDAVISDIQSTAESTTGILTFRSSEPVAVDAGSLVATVDGERVDAEVSSTTHLDRTALLVIDTSGSMGASGMATVRAATRTYLAEAPADVKIGVVTFADTAGVDLAPTTDRAAVQRVVDGLEARGDTSLHAAVLAAAKELRVKGDRSLVLLSDGADTVSTNAAGDQKSATQQLKKNGIRADVVRFATNDPAAVGALRDFAGASGGSVIPAQNAKDVGKAFSSAARALKSQAPFALRPKEPLTGTHEIMITGKASGESFTATLTADVRAAAANGAPPSSSGPPPLRTFAVATGPTPWIAAAMIGVAILLLVWGVLTPNWQTLREQRIAAIESFVMQQPRLRSRSEGKSDAGVPIKDRIVDFGEKAMKGRASTAHTMLLINRADLPLRAGEWWALRAAALVGGIVVGVILLNGAPWLGAILGGVLGFVIPPMVLRYLADRRSKAFERLLPQTMMLMASSLRSGFGVSQALDSVAKDSSEPISKEFSRALAETRIGTDIADALDHMAVRMGSKSMAMVVMAFRIQREVGGNLAETLETTAKTLRDRESLFRQVAALSAEGRLSAAILIALPICLFVYMWFVSYDYLSLLWTTLVGILMLIGGAVLLVVGVIWMRQVIRIEA